MKRGKIKYYGLFAVALLLIAWVPYEEHKRRHTTAIFHGRVLDQYSNTVAGAEVNFRRLPIGNEISGMIPVWSTVTDQNGNFHIHQPGAPTLVIGVSAPAGYANPHSERSKRFHFYQPPRAMLALRSAGVQIANISKHTADPSHPVIYRLIKRGETEPMVERDKNLRLRPSRDIVVGLTDDQSIQVKFWLDPTPIGIDSRSGRRRYVWGFELSIPGGGLIPREDADSLEPASYVAPESGYQETLARRFDAQSPDVGLSVITGEYFFKLPDGTFGRVNLEFFRKPEGSSLRAKSWYNPSGSRFTEFEPSKKIPYRREGG